MHRSRARCAAVRNDRSRIRLETEPPPKLRRLVGNKMSERMYASATFSEDLELDFFDGFGLEGSWSNVNSPYDSLDQPVGAIREE